jgi:hypothetical protein
VYALPVLRPLSSGGYRALFGLFALFPIIAIVLYSGMKRHFALPRSAKV